MIQISKVTKRYDNIKSLDSVTASIKPGSIFGLIGSNGSGKSTLLRVMSGIFRADSGEVLYDGENVYENVRLKNKLVYLSDDQYFLSSSTIDDMANLYASVYTDFSREEYLRLLDLFCLDRFRKVATFSKGMQKQAAILLGLSAMPQYLLCDETFDGLDPVMRQMVKRLFADAAKRHGKAYVHGGFAFSRRGGVDGCHENELAVRLILQPVEHGKGKLGLVFSIELQLVVLHAEPGGDFRDREKRSFLCDLHVGFHARCSFSCFFQAAETPAAKGICFDRIPL